MIFCVYLVEIPDEWMPEVQVQCIDLGLDVDLRSELFTGKTIMDLFNLLLKHTKNDFKLLILALSKVIHVIVKDAHEVRQLSIFGIHAADSIF